MASRPSIHNNIIYKQQQRELVLRNGKKPVDLLDPRQCSQQSGIQTPDTPQKTVSIFINIVSRVA